MYPSGESNQPTDNSAQAYNNNVNNGPTVSSLLALLASSQSNGQQSQTSSLPQVDTPQAIAPSYSSHNSALNSSLQQNYNSPSSFSNAGQTLASLLSFLNEKNPTNATPNQEQTLSSSNTVPSSHESHIPVPLQMPSLINSSFASIPTATTQSQPPTNISNLLSFLSKNNPSSSLSSNSNTAHSTTPAPGTNSSKTGSSLLDVLASFQKTPAAHSILKPKQDLKSVLKELEREQKELEESIMKERQALLEDHEQRRSKRAADDILSQLSSKAKARRVSDSGAEVNDVDDQLLFEAALHHECIQFDYHAYTKLEALGKSQRERLVALGATGFEPVKSEDDVKGSIQALRALLSAQN